MFLPHPRVKVSTVGSLRDREVVCSVVCSCSNFESYVWRTVSSQSSHHPQEVLLAQFSLYVHKGGLKPDSFHFTYLPSNLDSYVNARPMLNQRHRRWANINLALGKCLLFVGILMGQRCTNIGLVLSRERPRFSRWFTSPLFITTHYRPLSHVKLNPPVVSGCVLPPSVLTTHGLLL